MESPTRTKRWGWLCARQAYSPAMQDKPTPPVTASSATSSVTSSLTAHLIATDGHHGADRVDLEGLEGVAELGGEVALPVASQVEVPMRDHHLGR